MSVTDLDTRRPHYQGPAKCKSCGQEWRAVVLADYTGPLECPGCHEMTGELVDRPATGRPGR